MTDRDLPVADDDLHAYVDGELPPDRLAAVEAWLSTHPQDMARVAAWRSLADVIRARYGVVATERVPARLSLRQIERAGRSGGGLAGAAAVERFVVGGWGGGGGCVGGVWVGGRGGPRPPRAPSRRGPNPPPRSARCPQALRGGG